MIIKKFDSRQGANPVWNFASQARMMEARARRLKRAILILEMEKNILLSLRIKIYFCTGTFVFPQFSGN